jgi:hypothetical protein
LSLGKSESVYAAREFGQRLFLDIGIGTRTVREPYEVTKVRLASQRSQLMVMNVGSGVRFRVPDMNS